MLFPAVNFLTFVAAEVLFSIFCFKTLTFHTLSLEQRRDL